MVCKKNNNIKLCYYLPKKIEGLNLRGGVIGEPRFPYEIRLVGIEALTI